MTDLTKGIIEINGFILTRDSKVSDFDSLTESDARILTSKRGNKYITFLQPINSNGVDCYVEVSFYTDSTTPDIKFFPSVPDELKGDPVAQSKYKVAAAKQWLKGMLDEEPHTSNDSCVFYKFDDVDYFSSVSDDIHYGLVGGEINVTFHGE